MGTENSLYRGTVLASQATSSYFAQTLHVPDAAR